MVDPGQRPGFAAWVRLTGGGIRGCNERGGPEFVSSRRPVPSERPCDRDGPLVRPTGLLDRQSARSPPLLFGLSPSLLLTLDNLAEPSQRIDEDDPACAPASSRGRT